MADRLLVTAAFALSFVAASTDVWAQTQSAPIGDRNKTAVLGTQLFHDVTDKKVVESGLAIVQQNAITVGPSTKFQSLPNVKLVGRLYGQTRLGVEKSVSECAAICESNRVCVGYSSFKNGRCSLFQGELRLRLQEAGTVSGVRTVVAVPPGSGLRPEDEGDDATTRDRSSQPKRLAAAEICGPDFDALRQTAASGYNLNATAFRVSARSCQLECMREDACVGFVWIRRSGNAGAGPKCWLKRAMHALAPQENASTCQRKVVPSK